MPYISYMLSKNNCNIEYYVSAWLIHEGSQIKSEIEMWHSNKHDATV